MNHINGKRRYYKSLKNDDKKWYKVVNKIYMLISRLFIKIMAIIIIKEDFYKLYQSDLSKWAFELLVERINRYVKKDGTNEFGLLVMDSVNIKADNEKHKQIVEFMTRGTDHGWEEYPEQIINSPFIVSSELHNGVKIADAVVYLIRWYTRRVYGLNPKAFFHQYSGVLMKLIAHRFYEYPNVGTDTIKFFPTNTDVPNIFWIIFR